MSYSSPLDPQLMRQLQQQYSPLYNTFTGTLSPQQMAELQKAYGGYNQRPLSEAQREANLEAFNTNLQQEAKAIGELFAQNTKNSPIEQQYRAYEQARNALKNQYAHLSEEQQNSALSAFDENADVFKKADKEAGFFARTGDALSYLPTTATKLGEQIAGLFSPEGDARKWFHEATEDVENWRSDEAKLRQLIAQDKMTQAKANGELGFTQFFANAAESPLETLGQFAESAIPTAGAAIAGAAAAIPTGGASLALPFIVGGIQGAGETRNEIYDHIMAMPQAQLNQDTHYQALLDKGLSPEQARTELASSIREHGGEVFATGVSSAALSGLGGLGRIGKVGKGALGSTAGKFVSEAITEPTDEVFQQFMANKAIHDIDPTHSYTEGLGEAAAGGLLFGVAGGGVAALDSKLRQPSTQSDPTNAIVDDLSSNEQNTNNENNPATDEKSETEPQVTTAKPTVNGEVLNTILTPFKNREDYKELHNELVADIEDGVIAERANEDTEYGRLAKAYLEQTQPQTAQPQSSQTQSETTNEGNQSEPINEDLVRQQEDAEQQVLYSRSPMKSVEANIARGRERMTQAILNKADVKRGMYNGEFGWVDFVWGDDGTTKPRNKKGEPVGKGISHIIEARMRKNNMSETEITNMLVNDIVETVAKGTVVNANPKAKLELDYRSPRDGKVYRATLAKNKGNNAWILTAFEKFPEVSANSKGEIEMGNDKLNPTHNTATLTRDAMGASEMHPNVNEGASRKGKDISTSTDTNPTLTRASTGASFVASDSEQFVNPNGLSNDTALELGRPTKTNQLNDTHAHSQRGRGVVAENELNLTDSPQSVNNQLAQDQATLSRILGEEIAQHIQVVDSNTPMPTKTDAQSLAKKGVEGWFNLRTQKLYIVSDNIDADEVLSRDERLAWVAWHELAHAGIQVKLSKSLKNLLAGARQHPVVNVIAKRIQAEHNYTLDVATEEAMVEIFSAYQTGNWSALENRYRLRIHQSWKTGKDNVIDYLIKIANYFRRVIGAIIGRNVEQTMTTSHVFETLREIKQGIADIHSTQENVNQNSETRYSLNEDTNSEFAKAVDLVVNGFIPKGRISLGTTPDVLKLLGLPDSKINITGAVIQKVMGEYLGIEKGTYSNLHNLTPEVLKQLPKQMNNPVAVFRSSSRDNSYVALTELVEVDKRIGKNKPVVSALHIKAGKGSVDIIDVRSVYGRSDGQLSKAFRDDLLYFNKEKGQQFLNTHPLHLHWDLTSDANLSANNIKTEADLRQYQSEIASSNTDDIRYSRKQSVDDLAKTGKAKAEPTFIDDVKTRNYSAFKSRLDKAMGKLDEWFADSLRPVNDWLDSLQQHGVSAYETERLRDSMYRAKGVRDALNSELEQAYLKPLIKKVAEVAKANKLDELSAKRLIGYWTSGRYAIEKNNQLLQSEHQAMLDAKSALEEAQKAGDEQAIETASREYRQAERQYRYRKHDVELAVNSEAEFRVGTAGGWSNAEAENFMRNIEKHIPRKQLEETAELLYALNQRRLEIDHQSGRYTEEQYNTYKKNRHYVPLTGDPKAEDTDNVISGAGQNAVNIAKDRALKGRKLSEAEDGIDASWRAIGKSTTYAGWGDFKNGIEQLYDTQLTELIEQGYSEISAREQLEKTLGLQKSQMKGTTRANDNVLIRKEDGVYYEYHLPQKAMEALKQENTEYANDFLKVLSKPVSWYARGVTQWTMTFAPMNMMRDTWEKSEFIRVQKLYDQNGNQLDDKAMDKIGRDLLKNAVFNKDTWKAVKRFGFGQTLRDNVPSEKALKELLNLGGISTYSTYFAKTETDLVKTIKAENNFLGQKLEKIGELVSNYNKVFDTVSALSAYQAMRQNGIDPKQAAAKTLELTNFRKTGSKMRGIKALYMFAQPTAMGARNLMKYLSTPKGQKRFAAYMVVMIPLYLALRAMDDDDEGGNKMDQLGDITRYVPLPLGLNKYFKFPVGFGMPQLAWNMSVNMVKAGVGDISTTEAGVNILTHVMKTIAPISPSEISAANYPLQKLALTFTPTLLQPLMQVALDRNAFGSKITPSFVSNDKLKSEQSKSTTAEFWKDVALTLNDTFGIDMHPEQIKNVFDGYSAFLGSFRELSTVLVENPNREKLGRATKTPFLNQFIGTTNEFAIQSRYYEASEEAKQFANRYESQKERGKAPTLTEDERLILAWHNLNKKRMGELRSIKAKATKALRQGKISEESYEAKVKLYNKRMDDVQRVLLKSWRRMHGLNTN